MGEESIGSGAGCPWRPGGGRPPVRWPRATGDGKEAELTAGKREDNPAGPSNNPRGDVLRVPGPLKVATVEQIQQIAAPHLSYRHTDKPTPAKRKRPAPPRTPGPLSDLRRHGLAENGGQIPGGDTLRNLTPPGSKAATGELGRPVEEMGNPARAAGRTGASHPMTVNEAPLALLRPKPDLSPLAGEPADAPAAAQTAVDTPAGPSYATEVTLPATGTRWRPRRERRPGGHRHHRARGRVPLLSVEIDNGVRVRSGPRREDRQAHAVRPAQGEERRRS